MVVGVGSNRDRELGPTGIGRSGRKREEEMEKRKKKRKERREREREEKERAGFAASPALGRPRAAPGRA